MSEKKENRLVVLRLETRKFITRLILKFSPSKVNLLEDCKKSLFENLKFDDIAGK